MLKPVDGRYAIHKNLAGSLSVLVAAPLCESLIREAGVGLLLKSFFQLRHDIERRHVGTKALFVTSVAESAVVSAHVAINVVVAIWVVLRQ